MLGWRQSANLGSCSRSRTAAVASQVRKANIAGAGVAIVRFCERDRSLLVFLQFFSLPATAPSLHPQREARRSLKMASASERHSKFAHHCLACMPRIQCTLMTKLQIVLVQLQGRESTGVQAGRSASPVDKHFVDAQASLSFFATVQHLPPRFPMCTWSRVQAIRSWQQCR
jgi:hypothetical protein